MTQLAKGQTHRGADVACSVYSAAGSVVALIEAESIQLQAILKVIESEPLSLGHSTRDTHYDGLQVQVGGVKKGNALLNEILRQAAINRKTGKAFEKYSVLLKYRDVNTGTTRNVRIKDATITELDPFNSGGNFEKSTEGFTMIGYENE